MGAACSLLGEENAPSNPPKRKRPPKNGEVTDGSSTVQGAGDTTSQQSLSNPARSRGGGKSISPKQKLAEGVSFAEDTPQFAHQRVSPSQQPLGTSARGESSRPYLMAHSSTISTVLPLARQDTLPGGPGGGGLHPARHGGGGLNLASSVLYSYNAIVSISDHPTDSSCDHHPLILGAATLNGSQLHTHEPRSPIDTTVAVGDSDGLDSSFHGPLALAQHMPLNPSGLPTSSSHASSYGNVTAPPRVRESSYSSNGAPLSGPNTLGVTNSCVHSPLQTLHGKRFSSIPDFESTFDRSFDTTTAEGNTNAGDRAAGGRTRADMARLNSMPTSSYYSVNQQPGGGHNATVVNVPIGSGVNNGMSKAIVTSTKNNAPVHFESSNSLLFQAKLPSLPGLLDSERNTNRTALLGQGSGVTAKTNNPFTSNSSVNGTITIPTLMSSSRTPPMAHVNANTITPPSSNAAGDKYNDVFFANIRSFDSVTMNGTEDGSVNGGKGTGVNRVGGTNLPYPPIAPPSSQQPGSAYYHRHSTNTTMSSSGFADSYNPEGSAIGNGPLGGGGSKVIGITGAELLTGHTAHRGLLEEASA